MYEERSETTGQRLLFQQTQDVTSRELSSDTAVLFHLSTTEWLFSSMPVKNCCIITKPSVWRESARVANLKRTVMGRNGPRGSCGKKALIRRILNVVYVQDVEIKHLQAALGSNG